MSSSSTSGSDDALLLCCRARANCSRRDSAEAEDGEEEGDTPSISIVGSRRRGLLGLRAAAARGLRGAARNTSAAPRSALIRAITERCSSALRSPSLRNWPGWRPGGCRGCGGCRPLSSSFRRRAAGELLALGEEERLRCSDSARELR